MDAGHRASKKESTIVAPAGSIHTAASLMSPITNSGFRNATGSDTEDGVPVLKHVTIDSQDNNSSTAGGTSDGAGEPQGEPHGAINGGGTSANRSAAPAVKAQTEASAPDLASAALAHKGGGSPNTPVNSSADAAVASSNVTANSAFLLDGDGAAEPESEPAPFVSQNSVVVGGVVYGEGPGTVVCTDKSCASRDVSGPVFVCVLQTKRANPVGIASRAIRCAEQTMLLQGRSGCSSGVITLNLHACVY